jgi:hypothetical protein
MKVICVNNKDTLNPTGLTLNKTYETDFISSSVCVILNDDNRWWKYPRYRFKTISEYKKQRINTINEILQ